MTPMEEFTQWCTTERSTLRQQLAAYEAGEINLRERSAGAWVDKSDEEVKRLKKAIADLDVIIKRLLS
jgi:hypothetical protein